MVSNDDNTRTPSIGWVRQHVEERLVSAADMIGGELGDTEKRLREHLDQQIKLVLKMLEGQQTRIAALETRQSAPRAADRRKK